jgi:hypothetical protein
MVYINLHVFVMPLDHIDGIMVIVFTSSVVDSGIAVYRKKEKKKKRNNNPRVDNSLHSHTLSRFRTNQSLILFLRATYLAEKKKKQIPVLNSVNL